MTIEKKAGQLNFPVGDLFNTGPTVNTTESVRFDEMIRKGKITGLFNVHGAKYTARLQKIALEESRLHIPLLFGADVIHGFKTVMPLPLAEAASWDLAAIENSARVAAIESTAAGINFNFAPMVDISRDPRWGRISEGAWSFFGEAGDPISILEGIQGKAELVARQADVVIMALGESAVMNGEGASRSEIGLPGVQQELLEAIHKTGKPIIVLLLNGRPLAIEWMDQNIPAILETWTLGSQAGTAIADVVFGAYNPSGKLPVTFPRSVGQIPIFYSHKHGGRPYEGDYSEPLSNRVYKSKYRDVKNTPLYVFGYGLSYSTFEYSNLKLSTTKWKISEKLTVEVIVKNTSSVDGEEVIQLYIRDMVGSVTRPIKELKDFQKIFFKAGEEKAIKFVIDKEDLSFFQADLKWGAEPGSFKIMVGTNSDQTPDQYFDLRASLKT